MRTSVVLVLALTSGPTACTSSHANDDGGIDLGSTTLFDSSRPDLELRPDLGHDLDGGGRPDGREPPPGHVVCGGRACVTGQICCFTRGECFDPAAPGDCPRPDGGVSSADGGVVCASNADCATDEICSGAPHAGCAAVGSCVARRPLSDCGGFGAGVCGCDGRTYDTPCAADAVGVRVAATVPCAGRISPDPTATFSCSDTGTCDPRWTCDVSSGLCIDDSGIYACGVDAECPASSTCCTMLGYCVADARPDLCRLPPEGTVLPCASNDDCAALRSPSSPSPFGLGPFYCDGPGCDGPGGCRSTPGSCTGLLAPVCGCDGATYTNECEAARVSMRVAADAGCAVP